jgi:hypothetical protein
MKNIIKSLQQQGYMVCGVYIIDSQFLADSSKFISGCLACLSGDSCPWLQTHVSFIFVCSHIKRL